MNRSSSDVGATGVGMIPRNPPSRAFVGLGTLTGPARSAPPVSATVCSIESSGPSPVQPICIDVPARFPSAVTVSWFVTSGVSIGRSPSSMAISVWPSCFAASSASRISLRLWTASCASMNSGHSVTGRSAWWALSNAARAASTRFLASIASPRSWWIRSRVTRSWSRVEPAVNAAMLPSSGQSVRRSLWLAPRRKLVGRSAPARRPYGGELRCAPDVLIGVRKLSRGGEREPRASGSATPTPRFDAPAPRGSPGPHRARDPGTPRTPTRSSAARASTGEHARSGTDPPSDRAATPRRRRTHQRPRARSASRAGEPQPPSLRAPSRSCPHSPTRPVAPP